MPAIRASNLLAVISPVLILGIPLFDLLLVMLIRWRKGIPVTKGSPDHFALRLRRCNLSIRETAITTYIVGVLLGVCCAADEQHSAWLGRRRGGWHDVCRLPLRVSLDESGYAFMKKVVVIGGGLAGVSAAYHLLES